MRQTGNKREKRGHEPDIFYLTSLKALSLIRKCLKSPQEGGARKSKNLSENSDSPHVLGDSSSA